MTEKKLIVTIPDDLHTRLKIAAAKNRITIKDIVISGVTHELAKYEKAK